MAKRKFDTCFFERYAQITLETFLGSEYAGLVNEDRPDLQMPDKTLGIEVTRAMEPRKDVAQNLLREMAGVESPTDDRDEIEQIIKSGYGYGLQDGRYIGRLEYEYWRLAHPLRRIIESKVGKVGSGFYGDFKEYICPAVCNIKLLTLCGALTWWSSRDLHPSLTQVDLTFYVCSLRFVLLDSYP